MISDCVEVDCLINDVRKDGIFYSMATVSQKIAAAIGVSILGNCMDWIGYNGQKSYTNFIYTTWNCCFIYRSYLCLFTYFDYLYDNKSSYKKRYQDVLEALKKKEHGYKINIGEFKDLLIIKKKR